MRKPVIIPIILILAAISSLPLASIDPHGIPLHPPRGYDREARIREAVIRVEVTYDRQVAARHGADLEWLVAEALAIHTTEWRNHRPERFELASMRLTDSGTERDATYVLSRFLIGTREASQTIHVNLIGRAVEVYTARGRTPVRGLAFRGSDAVLISATQEISAEVLAYYLFHEIGHLWETYDLPFPGGDSTFGNKSGGLSFVVDAGNAQILEGSSGPAPREAANRAPAVIARKLEQARVAVEQPSVRKRLQDVVLHDPSPYNGRYVQKKKSLLAAAGRDRARVRTFLREIESTSSHRRADAETRQRIATHYWRANDFIARKDYDAAEREISAIRSIDAASTDVHLLAGAIEKKIRTRR